jgi:hypothetical protein
MTVFSETFERHLNHLVDVFERLHRNSVQK